jgi:hypothetical protein
MIKTMLFLATALSLDAQLINEIVISAPCGALWTGVVQAIGGTLQVRSMDREAGVIFASGVQRLNSTDSNTAVRMYTTARGGRFGLWDDFGVDAANFSFRVLSPTSCLVHMDIAYSARNILIHTKTDLLVLYTNFQAETAYLNSLKEAATERKDAESPSKIPAWVPVYPGSSPEPSPGLEGLEGFPTFSFTSKDPSGRVFLYYQAALKDAGFAVQQDVGDKMRSMNAQDPTGKRKIAVVIAPLSDGTTRVFLVFDKK